jgi:predicted nucleotidyltransferase
MASRPPPDFSAFIAELSQRLRARHLSFMLIGGQAVLLHGRPRLTEDIDVTLGAGPEAWRTVGEVCDELGLTLLPEDPEAFVRETFVLPARHGDTGIRVDFIFSTTQYEREAISRAVAVTLGGISVPFATAEDLILHKLFAGRPRDLEDVTGVVRRKGPELDWGYLERWGRDFAAVPGREGMPAAIDRLRRGDLG